MLVLRHGFRMSDPGFGALVDLLRALGIGYRSTPRGPADLQVDAEHGGRIMYRCVPDGDVWER